MRLRFDEFTLDVGQRTLLARGVAVPVQPKVFDLIATLAQAPTTIHGREELGRRLWPGVHVTEDSLHQLLRKARRALGDDPHEPRFIVTVNRVGWRFAAAVVAESEATATPGEDPHRAAGQELAESLRGHRVVLVHGGPGMGKSRLVREYLPRGLITSWIDLRTAAGSTDLLAAVARGIDVPLESGSEAAARLLARALAARGPLCLVLDAAEGVIDDLAATIGAWTHAAPALRVVVASRRQGSLAPGATVSLRPLEAEAARALLDRLAPPRGDEENHRPGLVERLGGIPLAITLAARRLRLVGAAELVARLDASLGVLADAEGRSLDATLHSAWISLAPPDQRVLSAAATFPVGSSLAALEALVGDPGGDVLASLDRLVDASLVLADGGALRVPRPVREHVLAAIPVAERAHLRGRWTDQLVDGARPRLDAFLRWEDAALEGLAALGPELIVAARAPGSRQAEVASLVGAALRYGGPWWHAREVLEAAASAHQLDALGLAFLGEYRIRTGGAALGLEALDEALALSPGDARLVAFANFLASRVKLASGAPAEAIARGLGAVAAATEARNPGLLALAHDASALAAAATGGIEAARAHHEAAILAARSPAHATLRGLVTVNFGSGLGHAGQHAEAQLRFAEALDALRGSPLRHLRAVAMGNLGLALAHAGRSAAGPALAEAVAAARQVGDLDGEAQFSGMLGEVQLWGGQADRARAELDRARDSGAPTALDRRRRALLAWAEGQLDLAVHRAGEAQALGDSEAAAWGALLRAVAGSPEIVPGDSWLARVAHAVASGTARPPAEPHDARQAWVLALVSRDARPPAA